MKNSITFSNRTNWHREPNGLSRLLEEIRSAGREVIDLTLSNPTEAGISYPSKELLHVLAQPEALRYQPDPRGMLAAREEVAKYYSAKGIVVDTDSILLTASTSEAYAFVFRLLCGPGDSVLIPTPSYPLFEFLAQVNDVACQSYKIQYDGAWHIDLASIRSAITDKTKAIVVVSPNNPTGSFLKKNEHEELASIAREAGCALIVDEVFADYGFDIDNDRVASTAGASNALTFTLNGLSKMAGLPQLKLGWIVVSGEDGVKKEALARLEILADTFLSVNTPVQVALPEIMKLGVQTRESIRKRVISNYEYLRSRNNTGSSCSLLHAEGGWNAVLRVPSTRTDEEWALLLLEKCGVYVQPGYFFDFEGSAYLVVSLLPESATFRYGIERILSLIEG